MPYDRPRDLSKRRPAPTRTGPPWRASAGATWETIPWREYRDAVRQAARALVATGVQPGQGVVILAFNRPEWFVANLATIAVGASARRHLHEQHPRAVPLHHGARGGGGRRWSRTTRRSSDSRPREERPPGSKAIVLMDGDATEPRCPHLGGLPRPRRRRARRRGRSPHGGREADDVATLIYTSGTTGTPEGRDAHAAATSPSSRRGAGDPPDRRRGPPHQLPAALPHRRAGASRTC